MCNKYKKITILIFKFISNKKEFIIYIYIYMYIYYLSVCMLAGLDVVPNVGIIWGCDESAAPHC